MSTPPMLAIDRVSVAYEDTLALDAVSVTVPAGQWVGVIGANGSGKTSLLRAVAHLQAHRGTVRVDGRPIGGLSHRRRAQLVAYVPQAPQLPAGMSVADYALLGRTPRIGYFGLESAHDRSYCAGLLDRLGLAGMTGRPLMSLSGGERQRAVLARALAQQAPVLLLDEPTSALDLGRQVEALELVDELRRERDLTVLAVMHDLSLAAQFADRLLLLGEGRVVAAGPPGQVLDETLLSECFGGRIRVLPDGDGGLLITPRRTRQPTTTPTRATA